MDYETWDKHTTELHNKHGHTCKPKPKERFSETSVYEFVNDWLPKELIWEIFSYCAAPHAPKKVIADHYDGIGQRFWGIGRDTNENNKRLWLPRTEPYRIVNATQEMRQYVIGNSRTGILTPENRLWRARAPSGNKLLAFLFQVRDGCAGYEYVRNSKGNVTNKCNVLINLQDNKVKGRTLLAKRFSDCVGQSRQEHRDNCRAVAKVLMSI